MLIGSLEYKPKSVIFQKRKAVSKRPGNRRSNSNAAVDDELGDEPDVALVRIYEGMRKSDYPGQELLKTQDWAVVPLGALHGTAHHKRQFPSPYNQSTPSRRSHC
jgi:hypothetical protein